MKWTAAVFAIAMAPVIAAAQQFQMAAPAPVDRETRFEVVAIKPIENANTGCLGSWARLERRPAHPLLPQTRTHLVSPLRFRNSSD